MYKRQLYAAITKAEQLGDVAAHITFATWLANGMAIHGMADRAVGVIDRAADLARKSGYTEVPLQLSIAKIRALANLPEPQSDQGRDMASKLITATLAEAQNQHVLGAQTELLNEAGQIAVKRGNLTAAESAFRQAVEAVSYTHLHPPRAIARKLRMPCRRAWHRRHTADSRGTPRYRCV